MIVLLVSIGAANAAVTPSVDARQASDYSLIAEVDGEVITVSIDDISATVGTLQIELRGVPPLEGGECVLSSGSGACAQIDGDVAISAFNLGGWETAAVIAELTFTSSPTAFDFVLERGTDLAGLDLVGDTSTRGLAATGSEAEATDIASSRSWVVPVVAVAVLGVLGGMVMKRRTTRPTSHTE
jgi:hypothetical protein